MRRFQASVNCFTDKTHTHTYSKQMIHERPHKSATWEARNRQHRHHKYRNTLFISQSLSVSCDNLYRQSDRQPTWRNAGGVMEDDVREGDWGVVGVARLKSPKGSVGKRSSKCWRYVVRQCVGEKALRKVMETWFVESDGNILGGKCWR